MKITVCIKQVPDTADIKWTNDNTMSREGVESIINPFDEYAAETALKIKDKDSSSFVTVISMGPKQAKTALKEVLAMGADAAFLLCDKYFAGSDTAATARVLASAIKEKLSNTDLILCGQCAIDGDTAQTGPSLAQNLGFGLVTNVKEILKTEDKYIVVKKETDDGFEMFQVSLPAVICMQKGDYKVRLPKISGRIKAQDMEIPEYNAEDLGLAISTIGIKGSPTYVKKAFRPEGRHGGEIIKNKTSKEAACLIFDKISEYMKRENE